MHTSILNFGFKPSILIGYQMWYDHCLPDCHSFKEFVDYLCQSRSRSPENPPQIGNFFDVYVKLMHQAAVSLESYVKQLLELFAEAGLGPYSACKELADQFAKTRLKYSSQAANHRQAFIKQEADAVAKIIAAFESRQPEATEADRSDHLATKVYQAMTFDDLLKLNADDLPLHAVLERELRTFAASLMGQWFALFTPLYALHRQLTDRCKKVYRTSKQERVLQQIIGSKEIDPELGAYNKEDVGTLHRNIARSKRNSGFFKQLLEFNSQKVDDEKYHLKADLVPIIFEETFLRFEKADRMHEMIEDDDDTEETLTLNFRLAGR